MNLVKNLLTLLISLFFALFIAEIIFRIFHIGYGNNPLERSKIYHHTHPLNYSFRMYDPNGEYGGHDVYYDNLGFRTKNKSISILDHQNNVDSILFLGDSFTEAAQVAYEDTFVNLVESTLGIPTINLRCPLFSIIYKLITKNIISKFSAKTVIMQIYTNDFRSDKNFFENAKFYNNEVIAVDGGENNFLISLLRKSYVARFLRKSQLIIQTILDEPTIFSKQNVIEFEKTISPEHIKFTSKIIKDISTTLKNQNKQLYVFLIQSKYLSVQNLCCKDDQLYNKFYYELNRLNVETIDVAVYFETYHDQSKLFFPLDFI